MQVQKLIASDTLNTDKLAEDDCEEEIYADTQDAAAKQDGGLGYIELIKLLIPCGSLVCYLLDVVTDIDLVVTYYKKDMTEYFSSTLACVVIAHLILAVTDLSMLWVDRKDVREQNNSEDPEPSNVPTSDGAEEQHQCFQSEPLNKNSPTVVRTGCCRLKQCETFDCTRDNRIYAFRVMLGLVGFGVIIRKLQLLYYIFKWNTTTSEGWKTWYEAKVFEAQRDSSNLAFFCAFTEDCPQSLLQLYIFVRNPVPIYESIGRSIITSVLNLPFAYANYYRSSRRQPKTEDRSDEIRPDLDTIAFAFYYLGLLGAVVERVLSIGLFMGTVGIKWGLIVLSVHFIGNFIFIHFYQKPPFVGLAIEENNCSKYFSITVSTFLYALVNVFIFADVNDRTRKKWRVITNYSLLFVENITFVILSFTLVANEYAMIYGMVIGVGCVVHVIMLSNYYMFLHPTVGDCFNCVDLQTETSKDMNDQVSETNRITTNKMSSAL